MLTRFIKTHLNVLNFLICLLYFIYQNFVLPHGWVQRTVMSWPMSVHLLNLENYTADRHQIFCACYLLSLIHI